MDGNTRRKLIDQMLNESEFVTIEQFQKRLGVSVPTIKRDLKALRDDYGAPIAFSRSKEQVGYYYYKAPVLEDDSTEELLEESTPKEATWYTSDDIFFLASTLQSLDQLRFNSRATLHDEADVLQSQILSHFKSWPGSLPPVELMKRVRVMRVDNHKERDVFEVVGLALACQKKVQMTYFTEARGEFNDRAISPARLIQYNSFWYVDAWCHWSQSVRTFLIDNIQCAQILDEPAKRVTVEQLRALDSGYGLYRGKELKVAYMKLSQDPKLADVVAKVSRVCWHKNQRMEVNKDGERILSVPYTNPAELVGAILKWGPALRVLGSDDDPQYAQSDAVKQELIARVQRLHALYAC